MNNIIDYFLCKIYHALMSSLPIDVHKKIMNYIGYIRSRKIYGPFKEFNTVLKCMKFTSDLLCRYEKYEHWIVGWQNYLNIISGEKLKRSETFSVRRLDNKICIMELKISFNPTSPDLYYKFRDNDNYNLNSNLLDEWTISSSN